MNRNLFNYTYVLPSEPAGRNFTEVVEVFGVMLGSFAGAIIVAGLIVAGLLRLTRRPNLTNYEHDVRFRIGIMSVIVVSFITAFAIAIPFSIRQDEAGPETHSGIIDALHDRGSTDFQFRLGDEVNRHTPLESLDYFIIRDSSRFNCRADVVDVEHTPESGNGHSMVSLRLVEEECDTGFNIARWESVVREHGRIAQK